MDRQEKPEEDVVEGATEDSVDLLDLVLAEHDARTVEAPLPARVEGIVIGRVVGIDADGLPRVVFPGTPAEGLAVRSMVAFVEADIGREAALMFEGADRDKPVVTGLLFQSGSSRKSPVFSRSGARATVDGERLVFSAEREIVLQCGEASITLTRAGKVLVRGTYLSSRSSGTHRIQGGSVQIN